MTAQTRSVLQTYFAAGARPSAAQFVDLTDSFALVGAGANALSVASAATGLVRASADTGSARAVELGAGWTALLSAATTAARLAALGAGAVGSAVYVAAGALTALAALGAGAVGSATFGAATTASAQQNLGVGAPFRTAFDAATTASAQSQLGISVGAGAGIATTAEASGGTETSAALTPGRAHFHPGVAKAFVVFEASGAAAGIKCTLREAYNVASVSMTEAGIHRITWGSAFPTRNYAWVAQMQDRPSVESSAWDLVPIASANAQQTTDLQLALVNSDRVVAGSNVKVSAISVIAYSR